MFFSKFYIFNAREEEKKPSLALICKECHYNMLSVPVGTTQKSMCILWDIHPQFNPWKILCSFHILTKITYSIILTKWLSPNYFPKCAKLKGMHDIASSPCCKRLLASMTPSQVLKFKLDLNELIAFPYNMVYHQELTQLALLVKLRRSASEIRLKMSAKTPTTQK